MFFERSRMTQICIVSGNVSTMVVIINVVSITHNLIYARNFGVSY